MRLTDLLKQEAEANYATTVGLFKMVDPAKLSWKPATGKNWMTLGQVVQHCTNACGSGVKGFVTHSFFQLKSPYRLAGAATKVVYDDLHKGHFVSFLAAAFIADQDQFFRGVVPQFGVYRSGHRVLMVLAENVLASRPFFLDPDCMRDNGDQRLLHYHSHVMVAS